MSRLKFHRKSSSFPAFRGGVTHSLGGPDGQKYDLMQSLDLDGDGDLDIVTCEERDQLGVVWYENPSKMK